MSLITNANIIGNTYRLSLNDGDTLAYIEAYSITDSTEIAAVNAFIKGCKTADIWDEIESCMLMSPTRLGFATGHKDAKRPNDANFDVRIYGTDPENVPTPLGWKGVLGKSNIAHATWHIAQLFNNDDFGYTIYCNSYETGATVTDAGNFIKGPWYRHESFQASNKTNFVTGGGGSGLTNDGNVPTVFTFRRDNDGTRFNEHYINGTLRGSRFNNPTDIIVANPSTNIRFCFLAFGNFTSGSGGGFSPRRLGTIIAHHPFNAAKTLTLNNLVHTYNQTVTPGGR